MSTARTKPMLASSYVFNEIQFLLSSLLKLFSASSFYSSNTSLLCALSRFESCAQNSSPDIQGCGPLVSSSFEYRKEGGAALVSHGGRLLDRYSTGCLDVSNRVLSLCFSFLSTRAVLCYTSLRYFRTSRLLAESIHLD